MRQDREAGATVAAGARPPAEVRRRRVVVGLAVALPLVTLVLAAAVALRAEPRVIARLDLAGSPTDVTVDCGLRGGASRDPWGEAASRLCAPVQAELLVQGGAIAVVGGVLGIVALAVTKRNRGGAPRPARWIVGVLLTAGVPALLFGSLLDTSSSRVAEPLLDADEVLDAVGRDRVVDAFEVLEVEPTRTGLRAAQHRWLLVSGDLGTVRSSLDDAGWELADVAEEFSFGWVTNRSTAAPDVVDVGLVADLVAPTADIGVNARRLLGERGVGDGIVAVQVRPRR